MPAISIFGLLFASIFSLDPYIGIPLFYILMLLASIVPIGLISTVIGYKIYVPLSLRKNKMFFRIFFLSLLLNSVIWLVSLLTIFQLQSDIYEKKDFFDYCYAYLQPVFFCTAIIISYRIKMNFKD